MFHESREAERGARAWNSERERHFRIISASRATRSVIGNHS